MAPEEAEFPSPPTPDMYRAKDLYYPTKDSHFLLNGSGDAWGGWFPWESLVHIIGFNTIELVNEGSGTIWTNLTSIRDLYQGPQLQLAWIVLPPGKAAHFEHGPAGGFTDATGERFSVNGLVVPEPGMLTMLAAGGLAVLQRRRRHKLPAGEFDEAQRNRRRARQARHGSPQLISPTQVIA